MFLLYIVNIRKLFCKFIIFSLSCMYVITYIIYIILLLIIFCTFSIILKRKRNSKQAFLKIVFHFTHVYCFNRAIYISFIFSLLRIQPQNFHFFINIFVFRGIEWPFRQFLIIKYFSRKLVNIYFFKFFYLISIAWVSKHVFTRVLDTFNLFLALCFQISEMSNQFLL